MTNAGPQLPKTLQVLLVDDNPIQLSLLRHLFQRHGHATLEARNGAEALIMLATEYPDVVVSDCVMPLLDGYQFCRLVKDDRATRHLPVLLLTAQGTGLARFWAKTCGADRFLVKGRDLDHVVEVATALAEQASKPRTAHAVPRLAQENFGVDAMAPYAVLAQVGHEQGARQHQLLEDLDETADQPGCVVVRGVEPGD